MTKILIDKETVELVIEALVKISKTEYHMERPPIESLEEKMRHIAKSSIPALRQALEQSTEQDKGCDYCSNALYAGTKCKNCGRVTEQSPKQELMNQMLDALIAIESANVRFDSLSMFADRYAHEGALFQLGDARKQVREAIAKSELEYKK